MAIEIKKPVRFDPAKMPKRNPQEKKVSDDPLIYQQDIYAEKLYGKPKEKK